MKHNQELIYIKENYILAFLDFKIFQPGVMSIEPQRKEKERREGRAN